MLLVQAERFFKSLTGAADISWLLVAVTMSQIFKLNIHKA